MVMPETPNAPVVDDAAATAAAAAAAAVDLSADATPTPAADAADAVLTPEEQQLGINDLLAMDADTLASTDNVPESFNIEDIRTAVEAERVARDKQYNDNLVLQQRAEAQRIETAGLAKTDIDYYAAQRGLQFGTPEQLTAFQTEMKLPGNEARYLRGAAAEQATTAEAQLKDATRSLISQMTNDLGANGMPDVLPAFNTSEGQIKWMEINQKWGGKGDIAAYLIDHGRQLERAALSGQRDAIRQEGARDTRTEIGKAQQPAMATSQTTTQTNNYSNADWVQKQMADDAEWAFRVSPDGKQTNQARVRTAVIAARRAANL